jgi:hypothetical protein
MNSQKALALGVSQTGKSTFAFWKALQTKKQLIVWDGNEVFRDVVVSPVYTPVDLQEALQKGEAIIVYDACSSLDRHEEFERVAAVLELYDGHTLLVDEAGDVQRPTSPNRGLDRLYRRSGRRGNDIFETTHKATDIGTLNRTLNTDTYLFAMPNSKSRKILEDEFSPEAAEECALLPDYVYIHYHNRTGQFEKVDDPASWYVDLTKVIQRRPMKVEPNKTSWRFIPSVAYSE